MKVDSVQKSEKSTVTLTFSVEAAEFEDAIEKAYRKERGRIQIAGFRKGKVPRKMIERMYGSGYFWETAVNDSYGEFYDKALAEAETEAVGKAQIEVTDISADGYTIKAIVPVKPEVTVSDYKGLTAVRHNVAVGETEVYDEIERMRKRGARIETVERPAADGDTVVIDYEGFCDGAPFEGGKDTRHSLTLGSHSFIPGFEEQLVGKSAGDEVDVNVTFPTEYHAPQLAGKDAVFKVLVHEVKQSILPDLDDEFAKDVSEFDTVAELRADIEKNIRQSREQQTTSAFENAVVEQLCDRVEGEIPDAMIDAQVENMVQNMAYRLQSQGLDMETYMQITGMNAETLTAEYRPAAEKQVKIGLALDKIAELEKLAVETEEVEGEYNKLAEQYKMPQEQVKIFVNEAELKRDLLREKASKLVVESAVAKEPEDAPKKPKKKSEAAAKKPKKEAEEPAAKEPAAKTAAKKPAAKKPSTAAKKPSEKTE